MKFILTQLFILTQPTKFCLTPLIFLSDSSDFLRWTDVSGWSHAIMSLVEYVLTNTYFCIWCGDVSTSQVMWTNTSTLCLTAPYTEWLGQYGRHVTQEEDIEN